MIAGHSAVGWRRACAIALPLLLAACVTAPVDEPTAVAEPHAPASAPSVPRPTPKLPAEPPASEAATPAAQPDAPPQREPWTAGAPTIRFNFPSEPAAEEEDDEASDAQRGKASWYGEPFHGRKTANGERYNMYELTAAHKTLPFGTVVKVKDLDSGRSVRVRINDRGPFVSGRVIDLSKAAADKLGIADDGVKPVSVTVVDKPPEAEPKARSKRRSAGQRKP
ncbi:MAG: septal ring lytic transglycosylase RlpA family protein [Burkholderiales bacterium]